MPEAWAAVRIVVAWGRFVVIRLSSLVGADTEHFN
jgi:hypothetical protein